MRTPYRHKFTLLFVLCCIVYSTESSRYKDNRRKSEKLSSASASSTALSYGGGGTALASQMEHRSLCSRHREMKLLCYCTPDESYVPVTKAECWIFQTGLLQNDTTWQLFYQQKKLRQLKFVVQNSGHLDYIPTKYIEPLSNLTTITIEYSQIQIVKSYAFASLPNLRLITLTNNQIEVLDKDAFANHIYLSELHLQHNQITEMDRFAFRNLPILMKLFLNRNNISTLHEEVFSELGKLEELNLEHNSISVLTSDMFKGLGNLKILKMTYNNLNFIGDTVFAELWSLQELELDDNHIERISERALDGLNNLQTLNLRNNVLKKLDNGLLRGTPALLSINLQDNLLETVTFFTFQPIMDNLVNSTSELLLSDNKFVCDCRLQWIFDLRNRTRNLQLKESLEEIVCTLHKDPKTTSASSSSSSSSSSNFVKPMMLDNEVGNSISGMGSVGGVGADAAATGLPKRTRARGSNRRQNERKRQSQKTSMGLGSTGIDASDAKLDSSDDTGDNNNNNNYADKNTNSRSRAMREFKQGAIAVSGTGTGAGTGAAAGAAEYYEDDATLFGQSHEFEDGLDFMKEPAIYMHQGQISTALVSQELSVSKEAAAVDGDVVVKLLSLCPTDLPCSGELSDPTELPLSRESIGMDVRSPLLTSAGAGVDSHFRGSIMLGIAAMTTVIIATRSCCALSF